MAQTQSLAQLLQREKSIQALVDDGIIQMQGDNAFSFHPSFVSNVIIHVLEILRQNSGLTLDKDKKTIVRQAFADILFGDYAIKLDHWSLSTLSGLLTVAIS